MNQNVEYKLKQKGLRLSSHARFDGYELNVYCSNTINVFCNEKVIKRRVTIV